MVCLRVSRKELLKTKRLTRILRGKKTRTLPPYSLNTSIRIITVLAHQCSEHPLSKKTQINIFKLHSVYWFLLLLLPVWSSPIKIIPAGIFHTSIKCTNFNCCFRIYPWFHQLLAKLPRSPLQNAWHDLNSWTRLISQPHSDGDMLADGGRCTNVTSQLLRQVYVAGQRYPPLVGHENMYSHRQEWQAWRKYVMVRFWVKERERNDQGLAEFSKGRTTSGLRK